MCMRLRFVQRISDPSFILISFAEILAGASYDYSLRIGNGALAISYDASLLGAFSFGRRFVVPIARSAALMQVTGILEGTELCSHTLCLRFNLNHIRTPAPFQVGDLADIC